MVFIKCIPGSNNTMYCLDRICTGLKLQIRIFFFFNKCQNCLRLGLSGTFEVILSGTIQENMTAELLLLINPHIGFYP